MSNVEEQLRRYYELCEFPTDSEEYQQSLDIYLTLRTLLSKGSIEPIDVKIVEEIISGYSFRKAAQVLGIDRRQVTSKYKNVIRLLEESL